MEDELFTGNNRQLGPLPKSPTPAQLVADNLFRLKNAFENNGIAVPTLTLPKEEYFKLKALMGCKADPPSTVESAVLLGSSLTIHGVTIKMDDPYGDPIKQWVTAYLESKRLQRETAGDLIEEAGG